MAQQDSIPQAAGAEYQVDTLPSAPHAVSLASGLDPGCEAKLHNAEGVIYDPMKAWGHLCLIFNITEFDCEPDKPRPLLDNKREVERLKAAFQLLGFNCSVYENLTAQEITDTVTEVAAQDDLKKADCLVCWIITYGTGSQLKAKDGAINVDAFIDRFRGGNCPHLIGKPKLFFVQAMNDKPREARYETDAECDRGNALICTWPVCADIFFACSSPAGSLEQGDPKLFMNAVTDVINRHVPHAPETMLLSRLMEMVLTSMDGTLSRSPSNTHGRYPTPWTMSTLTKEVIFSKTRDA